MMLVVINGNFIQLWLFFVLIALALLAYSWRQKHSIPDLIFLTLFLIYLFLLVDIVFFPIRIDSGITNWLEGFRFGINMIPFNWDMSFLPKIVLLQIFQNILLTVPFGFGICFIMKLKPKSILWISIAIGIGIELIQFLIAFVLVGYTYRVVDINDSILNTLGVMVGYGLFRVFGKAYIWFTQKFKLGSIEQMEILTHIRHIIQQHTDCV